MAVMNVVDKKLEVFVVDLKVADVERAVIEAARTYVTSGVGRKIDEQYTPHVEWDQFKGATVTFKAAATK